MQRNQLILILLYCFIAFQCGTINKSNFNAANEFPKQLVSFAPYSSNPIFTGTGEDTWDKQIRERGYIIREDNKYHLWYTGYSPKDVTKFLGYATSDDGINWTRHKENPIYTANWVEDMCVIQSNGKYYMFAEGDTAYNNMLEKELKQKADKIGETKTEQFNENTKQALIVNKTHNCSTINILVI
jgi:predicted GH43/DUF377 family glycosyl hydrolase